MQEWLNGLYKDLDLIASEIAVAKNEINRQRRLIYKLRKGQQKVLVAIKAFEEEIS